MDEARAHENRGPPGPTEAIFVSAGATLEVVVSLGCLIAPSIKAVKMHVRHSARALARMNQGVLGINWSHPEAFAPS